MPHDARCIDLVMLVFDFTDHDFNEILDRDQSVGAAIFINDQRHMGARCLHFGQQFMRGHGGRRVKNRAQDFGRRQGDGEINPPQIRQIRHGFGAA